MGRYEISNKWWDSLPHETKSYLVENCNPFNWGKPICVSSVSKEQKLEIYNQFHGLSKYKIKL